MTGRPVTFALYSKLIPSQYQGEYLGFMVAGGSAARTLGPFIAVYIYYHIEGPFKNTLILFGGDASMMIICLLLIIYLWPILLPAASKNEQQHKGQGKQGPRHLRSISSGPSSATSSANGDVSMHVDGRRLSQ